MARKPNYQFERSERDRQKAAKQAARYDAKQQRAAVKQAEQEQKKPAEEATERKA
jgi:hypothetical protein